jgi:hypothetical protein
MTVRRRQTAPECDLYIPGHEVHWIQARQSSKPPHSWGVLDEVSGQVITVRFLDRVVRYRNHHTEGVLEVAQEGARVRVSEDCGLLGIPLKNAPGHVACFCIVDADEPWRPCGVAPSVRSLDDLLDRIEDRGGFGIPGGLLAGMAETYLRENS